MQSCMDWVVKPDSIQTDLISDGYISTPHIPFSVPHATPSQVSYSHVELQGVTQSSLYGSVV